MPKGGIEQLTERISRSFPLTYITAPQAEQAVGVWCQWEHHQESFGLMSEWGWCESRRSSVRAGEVM